MNAVYQARSLRTYTPSILVSSLSLILSALTFRGMCKRVKEAGLQGIELVVFDPSKVAEYRKIAREFGLHLTLHQPWSHGESGGMLSNWILKQLGILPKDGYGLKELVYQSSGETFVAYGDRIHEVSTLIHNGECTDVNWIIQTASAWYGKGLARKPRMNYRDFLKWIKKYSTLPIVIDTVHLAEMILNAPTTKELMRYSEKELCETIKRGMRECGFYEGRVPEIHFNDAKGGGTDGRCLPGDGKLRMALEWLAGELKQEAWGGYLVPETGPTDLKALRKRVCQFF